MNRTLLPRVASLVALAAFALPSHASVVMNGTRFVYPAKASEITVKVSNVGKMPALVQAWIDDGDAKATPDTVDVPFNLTPPISRLEAGKAQTLRISFTEAELPADRESVYWINILEVPPKPTGDTMQSHLQLALRYRLKLFYRPETLKGSPEAAAASLAFARGSKGLVVRNDSDFHVAVNDLSLDVNGTKHPLEPMSINAHDTREIAVGDVRLTSGSTTVHFQTINDYGGFVEHDATLAP